MRKLIPYLAIAAFLFCARPAQAQLWSPLLNPTSGGGACSPATVSSPQKCAIDWTGAGVVGGIPSGSWTQSGSTIAAGSGDMTSTIQTALNSCGTNHFVLLGPGTFSVKNLTIPSNCVLRGSGTLSTIVSSNGTSGAVYTLGNTGPAFTPTATNITSGATAGSTSIVVASASGISNGTLLGITELNDLVYVTPNTSNGVCTWCDGTGDSAARVRGQTVEVTNVAGTTLTITPALYTNYGTASGTSPAQAWPFAQGGSNEGVELLQTYANGTGYSAVYSLGGCLNCWIKEVFDNYADADHVDVINGLHDEVRDSYFSNAFVHTPGSTDSEVDLQLRTSATLVENNILERLHVGVMAEWGAAGNVVGYNYEIGNFDSGCGCLVIMEDVDYHGAHPQFNLFEGNIGNSVQIDAFWGTGGNSTFFRNQFRATDTLASPLAAGRHSVNWSSTQFANQQMEGLQISFGGTNINSIGNVFGSADAKAVATTLYNSGSSPFTSTIVPSATRNYSTFFSATSVGYNTGSDSNGSSVASFSSGPGPSTGYWVGLASGSLFQHGNFDIASNSIIWNGVITHTLPSSFYRSSKPSWFGSVPWPAIGPDVTGGNVDASTLGGHVNANPAEACYNSTARDSTGIKLFNPVTCYYSGGTSQIYVGQTAAGAGTGVDCADQRAYTSLVAGDYAAGNTIHFCGTITGSAGSNLITVLGTGGSSGNPVTLQWETGAILEAPYFSATNGGINLNGRSWLVLNGGTNGIIENTANGTSLANQQPSVLIHGVGGNNVTVENLSLPNTYVHVLNDTGGGSTSAIHVENVSNLTVSNCSFTQADFGIEYEYDGGEQSLVITGNSFTGINTDIEVDPTTVGAGMSGIQVDHNTATNWVNWDTAGGTFLHNFFHPFTNNPGASISGTLRVYDNSVQGNIGNNSTSMIYIENNNSGSGGTMGNWYIFNNLFNKTNAGVPTGASVGLVATLAPNGFLYNNTFVDAGGSGANAYSSFHAFAAGTGWKVTNNIFSGGAYMVYDQSSSVTGNTNEYYNSASGTPWVFGATFEATLAAWRSACSCDASAITSNPMLNSDLSLQAGSPAILHAQNLTSTGIAALDSDYIGTARPGLPTSWDIGAYAATGGGGAAPIASFSPTSLTFPSTTVGSSSASMSTTLTNTGTATMNITSISITGTNAGDFSQTNTCSSTLAVGSSCTISVTFTPSAAAARSANVSVADNAAGSPQTVPLSGTGTTGGGGASGLSVVKPGVIFLP